MLAGGRGTRLGAAAAAGGKAAVRLGGRTLLEWVLAAVEPEVGRLVVVTAGADLPGLPLGDGRRPAYGRATVEVVRDSIPDGGPLAAVADALRRLAVGDGDACPPAADAIVVSCDTPFVRPAVVRLLLGRLRTGPARWALAHLHGHPQVFPSALRCDLLPAFEAHLAAGRRDVRGLVGSLAAAVPSAVAVLDAAEVSAVDPELESFCDIDTPDELAAAGRRLTGGDQPADRVRRAGGAG